MKSLKIMITFISLTFTSISHAGTILSPGTVIDNSMGELICCSSTGIDELSSQSGLTSNYISGVTDFNTFTTSGVTHASSDGHSWLSGRGNYSGYLVFDLGAEYSVENFAMWNGASGISASVNDFSLTTSLVSDFSVSTFVGNFTGQQTDFSASVYDMVDSVARYVRFDIAGNFGNSCCTAIGEVAFDVNRVTSSVPAPATAVFLGLGLLGMIFSAKRKPQNKMI